MNNTLTNIGTAYGRGYEMGKADAFLGFFTADDTVAEDFITDYLSVVTRAAFGFVKHPGQWYGKRQ